MFDLQSYLTEKRAVIDSALDRYLPPEERYPQELFRAVRYGVLQGGKRLRPTLTLAACEAVGGDAEVAMPTACAVEFIHAFSLIHDDLPALDNDDLRRGQPTTHKVFGEPIAILAGDVLLAYAFQTIAQFTRDASPSIVLEVSRRVAAATGAEGMVVGQVVDMISEGRQVDGKTMEFMHANKTGALLKVAVVSGGLLGGGTPEQVSALETYGEKIGLAFQIADDILDIVGDETKIGKPVGSDLEQRKSTYPGLYGLTRSRELARQASDGAVAALQPFDDRAEPLRSIARFIVERDS